MGLPVSKAAYINLLWLCHELLHLVLHCRDGVVGRAEPRHGLALLVDDELGEVPLDVAGRWEVVFTQ